MTNTQENDCITQRQGAKCTQFVEAHQLKSTHRLTPSQQLEGRGVVEVLAAVTFVIMFSTVSIRPMALSVDNYREHSTSQQINVNHSLECNSELYKIV